ncbi:hypothetical protein [Acinetobacter junii]|uniref:hypothetical protein n=1 Tax=Acinetobacter junii TaxID=40215 RepID=UPI0032B5EC76
MKKRGRPTIQLTSTDLDELNNFIDSLLFLSKQQERFNQISNKTDKTDFSDDQIKLIKSNLREMKVHKKRIETLEIIKFKTKTTQQLSDLEKEILSYDLCKRDDFFNCHKALNTYIRLEKITQSEIKRIDHKVRKVRKEQTNGQKRRKENERRKYFLGGVVLKYSQFLKDNYLFSSEDTEEAILQHLLEDFIVCNYLSDVTNNNEDKAANVKKVIKNNHSEIIEKIRNMSNEIENDKRK